MKPIYQVPRVKEGNPVVGVLLFLLIAPIILFAITFWSICSFVEYLGESDAYKASDPDRAFSKWGRDPLSSSESLNEPTERRVGARGLQESPGNRGLCRPGALTRRILQEPPESLSESNGWVPPLYAEHPEPKRL